jgi:tRNA dimethylallyltransferase
MSIGTAKPTVDEQQGIKHHFIDSHSVADEVSAARFAKEAEMILNQLFKIHNMVVLTGGSGMFVDALCHGIDDIPTDFQLRDELISFVESNGTAELLNELAEKDPVYFNQVDHSNPSRIIRAIQVIRSTGKPFSEQRTGQKKINNFEIVRFIIEHPREQLYKRINHRVDLMIKTGLIDEVRSLEAFRNFNALQTVGYKEVFDYLEGKVDLNSTVELIKQHTRNYAKRQITWSKRYTEAEFIEYCPTEQMLNEIINYLRNQS